jgi:hypothetical protein
VSGTHSILAPSGAPIWMQCARAPGLQAPYQDAPPTEESLEGDAAHWVALQIALAYAAICSGNEDAPGAEFPRVKSNAPNGVEIDQDMIDGGELFADVVGPEAVHEQRLAIHLVHPHCYGTPDARFKQPRIWRLYDYKYGHRWVEVYKCWQLIGYTAGMLEETPRTEWPDFIEHVVVQPRSYGPEGPVRRWTYPIDEIVHLINDMHTQAALAVDESGVPRPDAPAKTGPECRDCKARHACTLFQSVAGGIVDSAGRADLFELPAPQVAAELSYLDAAIQRLEARRGALAIQAETLLARGQFVPGYAMESSPGNLAWLDGVGVDEVAELGNTLGVVLIRDPQPVTPTQAKTILKRRALDPELLEAYASRPRGKMKLVQSTTIKARKAFGVVSK